MKTGSAMSLDVNGHDASEIRYSDTAMQIDLSAAERALVYRWLSSFFASEPTVETLDVYRSSEGGSLLLGLSGIAPLAPAVEAIRARVSGTSQAGMETLARDLSAAFSRLFLGVRGRRTAPPYKSFYVSDTGRLLQEPAARMQRELQRLGVRLTSNFSEPPDHIAVQLAVMAALANTADESEQAHFLDHQLRDWVGAFRDQCIVADEANFYTAMAHAMVDFIDADAAQLQS